MKPCRSCTAPIRWANNSTTGKAAPLDVEPSEAGNCRLYHEAGRAHFEVLGTPEARQAARDRGEPLFTNHFGTCPDAERFRR